jgi:Flp pilus assembly protein TadB
VVAAVTAALGALCGGGVGAGFALLAFALFGTGPRSSPRGPAGPLRQAVSSPGTRRRLLAAGGVGLVAGVLTRWPVAALLVMLLVWWWPSLFGAKGTAQQAIARINAVAAWAEMLRGMMAAAASIEQAIVATIALAPEPIRLDLQALAGRLGQGQPLVVALRPLADAIDDDTGDLVVGALILAADPSQRAGNLGEQLGQLASAARSKATMRSRVQADRARLHAAARAITLMTVGVIATLMLVGRSFLAPYGTALGQLALLGVGGVFAVGLAGLTWLGHHGAPQRFITARAPGTEGDPAG